MVERLILDDLVHWALNYKVIVYIVHWCSLMTSYIFILVKLFLFIGCTLWVPCSTLLFWNIWFYVETQFFIVGKICSHGCFKRELPVWFVEFKQPPSFVVLLFVLKAILNLRIFHVLLLFHNCSFLTKGKMFNE